MKASIIAAVLVHALLITGCALHRSVSVIPSGFSVCDLDSPNSLSACAISRSPVAGFPGDNKYQTAIEWMTKHLSEYIDDKAYAQYERREIQAVQDDLENEKIVRVGDNATWRVAVDKTMDDFTALASLDASLHEREVL